MTASTANNTDTPSLHVVPLYEYGRSVHDDVAAYRMGFCHGLHQHPPLAADRRCQSYDHGYRRASALRADAALHIRSDDPSCQPYQEAYFDGWNRNFPDEQANLTGVQYERGYMLGRIGEYLENTEGHSGGAMGSRGNSRDAERYGWLRDGGFFHELMMGRVAASGAMDEEFDAAVDQAIQEESDQKAKDADRYDWLRAGGLFHRVIGSAGASGATGAQFDSLVDRGMAEAEEE